MTGPSRTLRRFWLPGLAALVAVTAGGGWALNRSPADTAADPADPAEPSVVCFGYADTEHGVTSLYPLLPGRVTAVEVREGQAVEAGTVLIRLDDRVAKLHVRQAEADLEAAREQHAEALKLPDQQELRVAQQQSAVAAARHRLEGARHVLARKQDLRKMQLLPSREVDAAESLVREAEAVEQAEKGKLRELRLNDPAVGVRRAQAAVDAKQAQLEEARRGEDECALRAPVGGTVLRILAGPGDVLGARPQQPAVLFCPEGQRIVRAEVEQEFAGRVAVGQAVLVEDDVTAGPSWRGKVVRVSDWYTHRRSILPEPGQFNDVRTLECIIQLDPGQPSLRIGQRVRATLAR